MCPIFLVSRFMMNAFESIFILFKKIKNNNNNNNKKTLVEIFVSKVSAEDQRVFSDEHELAKQKEEKGVLPPGVRADDERYQVPSQINTPLALS